MQRRPISYPSTFKLAASPNRRIEILHDVPALAAWPSTKQLYDGFLAIRTVSYPTARSSRTIRQLLLAEQEELRAAARASRPHSSWLPPRRSAVWLLLEGENDATRNPSRLDTHLLDGFAHLASSVTEETSTPLVAQVRMSVACGRDALEVLVASAPNRSEPPVKLDGAMLLVTWFVEDEHHPGCLRRGPPYIGRLDRDRVHIDLGSHGLDTTGATWPRPVAWTPIDDGRDPKIMPSAAHVMQQLLVGAHLGHLGGPGVGVGVGAGTTTGAPLPSGIFRRLPREERDAFRTTLAVAAAAFRHELDGGETVLRAKTVSADISLQFTGTHVRLTPWPSLRAAAAAARNLSLNQASDTDLQLHSNDHFEKDAFPGLLLCRPGCEADVREYSLRHWCLWHTRGPREEAWAMHVASVRVRGVDLRRSVSLYGDGCNPGKSLGDGFVGRQYLEAFPVNDALLSSKYCVQACSPSTFVPISPSLAGGEKVALAALATFATTLAPSSPMVGGPSDVESFIVSCDIDQYGSIAETIAQTCRLPDVALPPRSPGQFGAIDLVSQRLTVGEAYVHTIANRSQTSRGLHETLVAMLHHSGPGSSLGDALERNAQITRAFMEAGVDADEARRLRRVESWNMRISELETGECL